jgi:hypothetical protein
MIYFLFYFLTISIVRSYPSYQFDSELFDTTEVDPDYVEYLNSKYDYEARLMKIKYFLV